MRTTQGGEREEQHEFDEEEKHRNNLLKAREGREE